MEKAVSPGCRTSGLLPIQPDSYIDSATNSGFWEINRSSSARRVSLRGRLYFSEVKACICSGCAAIYQAFPMDSLEVKESLHVDDPVR
jgi:hypothetical protein